MDNPISNNPDQNFCTLVGITLIQLQRTEFLIQGIISHFNRSILDKDKRFKSLTPEAFLSNDIIGKAARKQTLGVLFKFLKQETPFFDADKLDLFLQNRNKFVHNLWREEMGKKSNGNLWNEQAELFVSNFSQEIIQWQGIFKGMMLLFMENLASKHGRENDIAEARIYLAPYVQEFLHHKKN